MHRPLQAFCLPSCGLACFLRFQYTRCHSICHSFVWRRSCAKDVCFGLPCTSFVRVELLSSPACMTQEMNGEDAKTPARVPPRVSAAQLKALKRFGAVQVPPSQCPSGSAPALRPCPQSLGSAFRCCSKTHARLAFHRVKANFVLL